MMTKQEFKKIFKNIQPCSYREEGEEEIKEKLTKKYFSKCFDDLLFKVQNEQLKNYKKISKIAFSGYINLPMIISGRILEAFAGHSQEKDALNKSDFVTGMHDLFLGNLDKLQLLTFKIFDVDSKGYIIKEDVEFLLNYLNYTSENIVHNLQTIVCNYFLINSLNLTNYVWKIENENSDIFVILLMFIYNKQPFTAEVLKFYYKNCKIKKEDINKTNEEDKNQTNNNFIASPSKEIILYSKYLCKPMTLPRRKMSSKNIKKYKEQSLNMTKDLSEFNFPKELIIADDNSILLSNLSTEISSLHSSSKSLNNSFFTSDNKLYESIVYVISKTDKGKELIKNKIVLVDNNLFSFEISPKTNKFILKNVYPLSGCYFTICEEFNIQNNIFFGLAFLSQYGNTIANLNNILFFTSKSNLIECIDNFYSGMKIRHIKEEYEISYQLGKGVFSKVYLGINKQNGGKVAIKSIDKNNLPQEQFEMVRNEIDIMNFLKNCPHPNIVTPLDIFEDNFFIYYIMEYMPGKTLESYLQEKSKLDDSDMKKVIRQMASALSFLDKIGVIHRDIKTDNILLLNNDLSVVKLSDFGLSTIKFNNHMASDLCGTLYYSAPELLMNCNYDKKVDIWSLGVLSFRLVTGLYPFNGFRSSKKDIIDKICNNELVFPCMDLSKDCKYFIELCLNKNPYERCDINKILISKFITDE